MAKMEWVAVVDGRVGEVGSKRKCQSHVNNFPSAETELVQVEKGLYAFGDRYTNNDVTVTEGEVLPPERQGNDQNGDENMARGRGSRAGGDTATRERPDAPQVEDRTGDEQEVPEFENTSNSNRADGKGNTGKRKVRPWDRGQPNFEFLRKEAQELREVGARLKENEAIKEAATRTREDWLTYGDKLSAVRDTIKSNNLFNEWLKEAGLEDYADRNSRTDAMWMAGLPDSVLEQVPEQLHSPKAVRKWFRDRVNNIAEVLNSYNGDLAEQIATLEADDPVAAAFARAVEASEEKKNEEDRTIPKAIDKASKKAPRLSFDKLTIEAAAEWIIDKIKTHDDAEAIGELVAEAIERGDLAPEPEADEGTDEGDEDDVNENGDDTMAAE